MFDGPVMDAALGLLLLYLVLSLSASSVQEWIASVLRLRSTNLREGVVRLFGSAHARAVYEHPLVARLAKPGRGPSYIAPGTLASALLDVVARGEDGELAVSAGNSAGELAKRVPEDSPLHGAMREMAERTGGGIDDLRGALAEWIDEGMGRISGWYARRAKLNVLVVAAVLTVAANADTIHVIEELGSGGAAADLAELSLGVTASAQPEAPGVGLADFPIGWDGVDHGVLEWLQRALGWIITIAAVSLGAPFWFDLLGRVANLRGAGTAAAK